MSSSNLAHEMRSFGIWLAWLGGSVAVTLALLGALGVAVAGAP